MIALIATAMLSAAPAEVRAVADAFDAAQFHHDVAKLDAMIAPDFVFVRGSGKVTGKAEFLDAFSSKTEHYDPFVITDRRWIPLGPDAAIVGGDAVITGEDKGERFSAHFQFADSFHRIHGKWQAVYTQVTPLPGK